MAVPGQFIRIPSREDQCGVNWSKTVDTLPHQKPYSENTAQLIDETVRKLIDIAYKRTKTLLTAKREEVKKVAELLLEKEVIGRDDMIRLLGVRFINLTRPFEESGNYVDYLGGGAIERLGDAPEIKL